MNDYKARFIAAHKRTLDLGLNPGEHALPFKKQISEKKMVRIYQFCLDFLYSQGLDCSENLASNCIPVNMMLTKLLKSEIAVSSVVTVGDKFWSDYVYCRMSYRQIENELNCPDVDSPLKAHAWLTLSDGSVVDFTGEAHMDVLQGRGNFPAEKCVAVVRPKDNPKDGYYRPFLVGGEFFERVGAFQLAYA